jgi:hypothetical protein
MSNAYALCLSPVSIGKRRIKTRRLPPSLNARLCWQERAAWTKAWKESVGWELKAAKIPKLKAAHLTLVNCAIRLTDIDNLASAAKPIIDAIVGAGILEDDDPAHLLSFSVRSRVVHSRREEALVLELRKWKP